MGRKGICDERRKKKPFPISGELGNGFENFVKKL
jgi:hypothetical protein